MNEKSKLVGIRRDGKGDIQEVKLADGNVYPLDQAIQLAKDNLIDGVNVSTSKNGTEYLRANPDGTEYNNLDNMPSF